MVHQVFGSKVKRSESEAATPAKAILTEKSEGGQQSTQISGLKKASKVVIAALAALGVGAIGGVGTAGTAAIWIPCMIVGACIAAAGLAIGAVAALAGHKDTAMNAVGGGSVLGLAVMGGPLTMGVITLILMSETYNDVKKSL